MSNRALSMIFVVLWASGYVVGSLAVQVTGPFVLLELRFMLASLLTLPLALRHGRHRGAPLGRLALLGLLLQVLQFGGVYSGLAMGVPAGVSALVMLGLSPLLTAAVAVRIGQERGHRRRWLGLAIGAGGVCVGLLPELSSARIGAGLALTVLGMLGLVGGTVLQKRHAAGVDPRVSVAVQSLTAAAVLAPVTAIVGGRLDFGAQLVLSVGWIGAGMGVLTVLVLIRLLADTSPSHVGALLLLVPALTALASAPVLGQPVHPLTFVGMIVAVAGVATALRPPPREVARQRRLAERQVRRTDLADRAETRTATTSGNAPQPRHGLKVRTAAADNEIRPPTEAVFLVPAAGSGESRRAGARDGTARKRTQT